MQIYINKESDNIIGIVETLNKRELLSAVNLVIRDVYNSGMKAKKYLNTNSNENFNALIYHVTAV